MIRLKTAVLLFCLACAVFVTAGLVSAGGRSEGPHGNLIKPQKKFKSGEILVRFKSDATEASKNNLHKKLGSEKIKEFRIAGIQRVKISKKLSVEEAVKLYSSDSSVEYAEPNFLYSIQAVPNDPRFSELWGLQNTGQTGGSADSDIDAPEAWDITTGSGDVVVAVIDTGVDYSHEDLHANMWTNTAEVPGNGIDDDANGWVDDVYGIDAVNADGDPMDDFGHGTHVSGTIGATGNNSIGVVGVNWNVRIMALKFLGANGGGYTSGAIECLDYMKAMKDRGVNIVASNNSWGGGGYSRALQDAINAAGDVLFIASAGNSALDNDLNDTYPANYQLPNVIAVAATDSSDLIADFSNFGRHTVSVGAPGVSVMSALPAQNYWGITGGYGTLSGTSMASPHVTGLAALLKSADPGRDWRAIKNLILAGGDNTASVAGITITGKRVNAYGAAACSGKQIISGLKPGPLAVGLPTAISVLSINCESPAGPVTATVASGGSFNLSDDGVSPDMAAGDGIFTTSWTPVQMNDQITFTSPAGTDTMAVQVSPITILSYDLPTAMTGVYYSVTLEAAGGAVPYTWSVVSGSFPAGLTLNPATGELSGTPQVHERFYVTVQVTDALGAYVTQPVWGYVIDKYEWMRKYLLENSYPYDGANAVAADSNGNVFVTGLDKKSINVWDDLLTVAVTVKYDPAGNLLWARTYDTGYYADAQAIAVDGQGNAYVAGYYYNGLQSFDWFVIKYDPAGNLVQTITYSATGEDKAYGIAVDASGNIYVTGSTTGRTSKDMLTIKYDASGRQKWAKTYNGGNDDIGNAIAVDGSGNVAVAGSTFNETFSNDVLVIKYGSTGKALWSRTSDVGNDIASGVGFDGSGNVYACGTTFWSNPNSETSDTMLLKFTASGQWVWAKMYDLGGMHDIVTGLAVAPNGNFYVSMNGYKIELRNLMVYKFDPNGNEVWLKINVEGGTTGIALDNAGSVYVAGTTETVPYNPEYFVMKYQDMP